MRLSLLRAGSVLACLLVVGVGACSSQAEPDDSDPAQVDSVEPPQLGACRVLTPDDVSQRSNATRTVDCTADHNAETFAIGTLPDEFAQAAYDAREVGSWAYDTCSEKFAKFLGADESLVMRTVVNWAWFRPSERAWDKGARWYRCDIVGGGEQSRRYVDLPESAKGLLQGRPKDRWMVCANGTSVNSSPKIPCTQEHRWRAVTSIRVGQDADPYPGDRLVEVTSRDFCSKSVGAWLGYPDSYDFGYTWFHEAEWEAGNRRSVCWAATNK